ncbi:hypothetical protein A1OE_1242 [Candidatus Endolissoclinum faulkneri L2]|uniref:Uncharacterized protein n=1 Tax=Candidatus Endolissoclinum faulkneri L2 TaxID=1193729 RepID=K7ZDC9_9PROT|nr:hypothetical protein A1OE_1242 [Candidatus Endolissoclinum faulkneri L2]
MLLAEIDQIKLYPDHYILCIASLRFFYYSLSKKFFMNKTFSR